VKLFYGHALFLCFSKNLEDKSSKKGHILPQVKILIFAPLIMINKINCCIHLIKIVKSAEIGNILLVKIEKKIVLHQEIEKVNKR
jgi:hypothetical protein